MFNHSGQMNIKTWINIKSECLRQYKAIWQKKKTVEKPSFLELITGFEPVTSSLPRMHSTT